MPDHATALLAPHVDEVIDLALRRERIVGGVVMIALDGSVVYHRAVGFANRERAIEMREDTIFRLASLTKPIVSTAALRLVEEGAVSLDEAITTWLPDFRPRAADGKEAAISVRHLLTHTAGLDYGFGDLRAEFARLGVSNGLDRPGLGSDEELRRLAQIPLRFPPGTAWNYSLATDVLGEVIARASGLSLPALVDRLITGPLRMTDTAFEVRDVGRLATAYADGVPRPALMLDNHEIPNKDGVVRFSPSRILDPTSFPSGGAGMAGTAADFLQFLEAVRQGGGPILSERSVEYLTRDQLPHSVSYPDLGWRFGMGAAVLWEPGLARTLHDTGTWRWGGGYGHDWFVNPVRRLTVVSLTNTAFEGVDGAYPQLLRDAIYYALTVTR
jgi:CubicO group peptidase (beta-lactamase class C family)